MSDKGVVRTSAAVLAEGEQRLADPASERDQIFRRRRRWGRPTGGEQVNSGPGSWPSAVIPRVPSLLAGGRRNLKWSRRWPAPKAERSRSWSTLMTFPIGHPYARRSAVEVPTPEPRCRWSRRASPPCELAGESPKPWSADWSDYDFLPGRRKSLFVREGCERTLLTRWWFVSIRSPVRPCWSITRADGGRASATRSSSLTSSRDVMARQAIRSPTLLCQVFASAGGHAAGIVPHQKPRWQLTDPSAVERVAHDLRDLEGAYLVTALGSVPRQPWGAVRRHPSRSSSIMGGVPP